MIEAISDKDILSGEFISDKTDSGVGDSQAQAYKSLEESSSLLNSILNSVSPIKPEFHR